MINTVRSSVNELLKNDPSGHGMDHIERVYDLAITFAKKESNANIEIVALIALLHDVDDYKLFGKESANNLTNAKSILKKINADDRTTFQVLTAIQSIGYNKRLNGIVPQSLEAKIVSDADMCDALGITGILRTYAYSIQKNRPFFDRTIFPRMDLSAEEYKTHASSSSVCHLFEKILKLKNLMLTNAGKQEASQRHQVVVEFLYNYFKEQKADEWITYLDNYLQSTM